MVRLPTPGGDIGSWGEILNSFLEVAHNSDGSLQASALISAGGVTTVNGVLATGGDITLTAVDVGALAANSSAGGDLSGSYPNPTVAKLSGVTIQGSPTSGQALIATSAVTASWTAATGNTDWINVMSFGATGDGNTDDTAAIQAADNAAQTGQVVYFPKGIYRTTTDLKPGSGRHWMGPRGGSASGNDTGLDYGAVLKPLASWITTSPVSGVINLQANSGIHITDLSIDGGSAPSALDGIVTYGSAGSFYGQNIILYKLTGRGMALYSNGSAFPDGFHLNTCVAQSCGLDGFYGSFVDTTAVNVHSQSNGTTGTGDGFYISGSNNRWIGCRADLNVNGFTINASGGGGGYEDANTLVGCGSQRNNHNGLNIINTSTNGTSSRSPVIMSGCVWSEDGHNGSAGGGGYAGIAVQGTNTLIGDALVLVGTVDAPGGSPQYGLSTSGPGQPLSIRLHGGLLNYASGGAAVNDAAPAQDLNISPNVEQASGFNPSKWAQPFLAKLNAASMALLTGAAITNLLSNTTFETGLTGWGAENGVTFTQSSAQAHSGSYSGLLTPDGATSQPQIESNVFTCVGGSAITFSAWQYVSGGPQASTVFIHFYDSNSTHISGADAITSAAVTNAWQQQTITTTVPLLATSFAVFCGMNGTPANTVLLYVDDLSLSVTASPLALGLSGDTYNRWLWDSTGKSQWGSGSGVPDTTLYRSAAASLKTDSAFIAGTTLSAGGLSGSVAASRYAGATAAGAPSSGTYVSGDYVIDQTGGLWVCTSAGTPGTWTKLAPIDSAAADLQPAGIATAGSIGKAADAGHVHPYFDLSLLRLEPSGATGATFPRFLATTVIPGLTSGTAYFKVLALPAGVVVNNITFFVNTTAAAGLTHGWYALLDSSGVVRAVSNDQTSGTWGTVSQAETLSVSASGYTTPTAGAYYVVVMVAASTMPTFTGMDALASGMNTAGVTMSGTCGANLTSPPVTGTSLTLSANGQLQPYAFTS